MRRACAWRRPMSGADKTSLNVHGRFSHLVQRLPLVGKLRGVQPLVWLLGASAALFFIQVADEMAEGDTLRIDRMLILALRVPGRLDTPIGPLWLQQAAI